MYVKTAYYNSYRSYAQSALSSLLHITPVTVFMSSETAMFSALLLVFNSSCHSFLFKGKGECFFVIAHRPITYIRSAFYKCSFLQLCVRCVIKTQCLGIQASCSVPIDERKMATLCINVYYNQQ